MKFQSLVRRFVTYYESMAREFALNVKQINKACDWFRATLVCHIYIPLPEHSTVWTVCKRSTFHYLMKLFSGVKRNFPPPHSTVQLPPHTLSGVVRVWCLVRLCIWFVWISQCVKLSLKDRFIFFHVCLVTVLMYLYEQYGEAVFGHYDWSSSLVLILSSFFYLVLVLSQVCFFFLVIRAYWTFHPFYYSSALNFAQNNFTCDFILLSDETHTHNF